MTRIFLSFHVSPSFHQLHCCGVRFVCDIDLNACGILHDTTLMFKHPMLLFRDISISWQFYSGLNNGRNLWLAIKKKYKNEAIFLSANDLILLLNGKKNDLWRLSFFYVILFSVCFWHIWSFSIFFRRYSRRKNRFRLIPSAGRIFASTRRN